jgi:hypothetical protein
MPNERRRGQWPAHHDQVPPTLNERRRGQRPVHHHQVPRRHRGHRLGTTAKYLQCPTGGAAGNGSTPCAPR